MQHILPVHGHGSDHGRHDLQAHLHRVTGVEDAFLVLLHVLVVGKRQALQRGEQTHQVSIDPSGLSPHQFRHIGVALLRHDGRARGIGIGEGNKAEFPAGPQDQLLGEPGEMHHQDGQRAQQLQGEIPVRNTVHAVEADAVKAEYSCLQVAVGVIGRPRQGAAADR